VETNDMIDKEKQRDELLPYNQKILRDVVKYQEIRTKKILIMAMCQSRTAPRLFEEGKLMSEKEQCFFHEAIQLIAEFESQ